MFRKMSAWRNKRKQWKSVNNGTSFHISPTADVSLIPAVFVLFWVTVETQRSGEKANVSRPITPGERYNNAGFTQSRNTEGKMSFSSALFFLKKQHRTVQQRLGCPLLFFLFFFKRMLAERTQTDFYMNVSRPTEVRCMAASSERQFNQRVQK